jgi:hypothetical protein
MKTHGEDICTKTKTAVSFVILVMNGDQQNGRDSMKCCLGENIYVQDEKILLRFHGKFHKALGV